MRLTTLRLMPPLSQASHLCPSHRARMFHSSTNNERSLSRILTKPLQTDRSLHPRANRRCLFSPQCLRNQSRKHHRGSHGLVPVPLPHLISHLGRMLTQPLAREKARERARREENNMRNEAHPPPPMTNVRHRRTATSATDTTPRTFDDRPRSS